MYDIVNHTLSANVADNGTFAVQYPAGRSAGSYTGGVKHKMFAAGLQTTFESPAGFTISFGATEMTVTYKGSTTLPQGTRVGFELQRLGDDANHPEQAVLPETLRRAGLHYIDLGSPDTADADGIVASQDLTSAGVFSSTGINGAYATVVGSKAVLDVPRNVVAAWTGTAVLTVTGKDEFGATMKESSGSGTSFTGKKAFKEITGIAVSANVTSLTVGTADVLGLPVRVPDAAYIMAEMKDGTILARKPGKVYIMDRMLEAAVDAATAHNIVCPVAGRISKLTTIAQAGITTGGNLTVEVNTVAVDGLAVVIANSSSEGDVDSDVPTAGHATAVVAVGDRIEIVPGAAIDGSADLFFILEIDVSAAGQLDGTFVAAVDTEATATTGDVRGTYDPAVACDGAAQFALLATLTDPAGRGVAQYAG